MHCLKEKYTLNKSSVFESFKLNIYLFVINLILCFTKTRSQIFVDFQKLPLS